MGKGHREPTQFQGCGECDLLKSCTHQNENTRNFYNIQEATNVNYVARTIHNSNATMEEHQEYY